MAYGTSLYGKPLVQTMALCIRKNEDGSLQRLKAQFGLDERPKLWARINAKALAEANRWEDLWQFSEPRPRRNLFR